MEFLEKYKIKEEFVNETLTINSKMYVLVFDVSNTKMDELEYYFNNGFDFVFELIK